MEVFAMDDATAAMVQALESLTEKLDAVQTNLGRLFEEMRKECTVTREGLALVATSLQELARANEGKEHAARWRTWESNIDCYIKEGKWDRGDSDDGHWQPTD